ncbi:MAG: hypothetical protein CL912_12525 [Deltaproteobacteria bacterium]|nr:hypothetical protein [Deltaproteobacteria bacterium]
MVPKVRFTCRVIASYSGETELLENSEAVDLEASQCEYVLEFNTELHKEISMVLNQIPQRSG